MSLLHGLPWSYKSFDFRGYSIAGQTTSLVFKTAKICFDIAQGLPFHLNSQLFCLTHMHADHGSGIAYVLSLRSLFQLPKARIMLPEKNIESIHKILQEWMKIEGFQYDYELIPAHAGASFDFSNKYRIACFPTTHRVTSFGYLIYEKKKKLSPEFEGQDRQTLMKAKSCGIDIEVDVETPIIAFTGDTQIEFLQSHPDVLKAQLLFMECTYLDDKKDVSAAREWGHIHLDEIVENQSEFKNEHISLIHLSARYSTPAAERILQEKLDDSFREKLSIFPRPL